MYMKSWSSCCCPLAEGGFNIKEILSWNKANLCKWLWRLLHPTDSLWALWHTHYNLQHSQLWTAPISSHHSESWRSILSVRDSLLKLYGNCLAADKILQQCSTSAGHFLVCKMYDCLRPKFPIVRWAKTVWTAQALPKHSFITALAAQTKLATVDNLCKRGMYLVNWCVLCKQAGESHHHLFFKCPFSNSVWRGILGWMSLPGRSSTLRQELLWCALRTKRKHWKACWFGCCLTATVYTIWQERNARIFSGKELSVPTLLHQIKFHVAVKILDSKHSKEVLDHLTLIYA
ncbi:uncharacterized protein LOC141589872 [Silene latifolia]|uniref:uncharacterized protein LOC141589872 n=1 Tax=Silene latifolia TaxID=37657 RepID=UPI003D782F84